MTVNRDTARRYTARARAAALVLCAAAVAVVVLPLPFLRPASSSAAVPAQTPVPEGPADASKPQPPIDTGVAISTLWQFGLPPVDEPAPAVAAKNATPAATAQPGTTAAPAVTPGGWRYIGNIMGPRGMHALLEREGRQKLVKVGDELEDARVAAIDAGSVTLDDGRAPRQIKIAARTTRWVAGSGAPAPTAAVRPAATPGRSNIPNVPGMLTNRAGQTQGQVTRSATAPPPRTAYSTEMSDEERQKYEAEKREMYREAGEGAGLEQPVDGGSR